MAEIARKYADRLPELKKYISEAQEYFDSNVKRYNKFMQFVFNTSMTQQELGALKSIGKPTIEFNILEAYVNRLRGEFAKQEPNLSVRAADGVPLQDLTKEFVQQIEVIEAHLKSIFFDAANDMLEYNIYTDLLAGGFSVMRVFTEYVNELSFEQRINVKRVFDPCLTGFDPLARDSHKGDGRFCFELYPMTRGRFEDEYGMKATQNMKFTKNLDGFNWSFNQEKEDIVLVCDFYEKYAKREKIIKLSNGHVVTQKEYQKFLEKWEREGILMQPPVPTGEERYTVIEKIIRYRLCETEILDRVETNYKYLPLVFVDGNSVTLNQNGSSQQMTRPYVFHAEGVQRLKNFAGQSLANELENTIQHKFIVAKESIPTNYQTAYQDIQKADTLIYNHFYDKRNPEIILPPPREVTRTPIPPEISNTFTLSDQITQAILGSYNGANGVERAAMSGIAFARSAITSNNSSMPYIVGYIKGINRCAQIIMDLIPKYYRTPRTLPIQKGDGKREFIMINKRGSVWMDYDPNSLQVKVEAGVNFAMQKEIAMQTIISLSQNMPVFADFMGKYGLQPLLDNLEIRGIEDLKEKANEYQAAQAQQAQVAQQEQQQALSVEMQKQGIEMAQMQKTLQSPTPGELGMAAISVQANRDASKNSTDAANTAIKQTEADAKFLETIAKIRNDAVEVELKKSEVDAENMRSAVDMIQVFNKDQGDDNGR